jgi:hypothetical protein
MAVRSDVSASNRENREGRDEALARAPAQRVLQRFWLLVDLLELRCLRDRDLLEVVMVSTGHSEVEERWLRARGCRSWLNHFTHVTDRWDNFWHDEVLRLPVMALARQSGYRPDDDGPPAELHRSAPGGGIDE